MRNFRSTNTRLAAIEGARGKASMVLRFADGSTRAAKISADHRLRLLLDSFDRSRSFPPAPEGQTPNPAPAVPVTESDSLLIVMENASDIETDDRLLRTIFGIAQSIGQRRKEKASGNAPMMHQGN